VGAEPAVPVDQRSPLGRLRVVDQAEQNDVVPAVDQLRDLAAESSGEAVESREPAVQVPGDGGELVVGLAGEVHGELVLSVGEQGDPDAPAPADLGEQP
jgi:hypothetical protein